MYSEFWLKIRFLWRSIFARLNRRWTSQNLKVTFIKTIVIIISFFYLIVSQMGVSLCKKLKFESLILVVDFCFQFSLIYQIIFWHWFVGSSINLSDIILKMKMLFNTSPYWLFILFMIFWSLFFFSKKKKKKPSEWIPLVMRCWSNSMAMYIWRRRGRICRSRSIRDFYKNSVQHKCAVSSRKRI